MEKRRNLTCIGDYADAARQVLPYGSFQYFARGVIKEEQTKKDSCAAFSRYRLRPRVLRGVAHNRLSTTILGHRVELPFGIAPTAFQAVAHRCAERGSINAANKHGALMVLSSLSSTHLDVLHPQVTGQLLWMQMYFFRTHALTEALIRRAERAGVKALVITIDSPGLHITRKSGPPSLESFSFTQATEGLGPANLDVVVDENRDAYMEDLGPNKWGYCIYEVNRSHATEEDILWLKSFTKLPIVLKGVLSGNTARKAVSLGVDGLIVSAHGGRQLDGAPAPIDVLPEIVDVVQGSGVEVYMDGGIRTGTDVLKALALGARAVFVGRPVVYGLAVDGQRGVENVLQILKDELNLAMTLAGVSDVNQIPSCTVIKESSYLAAKL